MENTVGAMTVQEAANKLLEVPPLEEKEIPERLDEQDYEAGDEDEEEQELVEESDDEEGVEAESDEPDEPEPVFTVLDPESGEEIEVNRDEARNGYLRHADYTRKTMKVAEKDKELEREREEVAQLRAQYVEVLPKLRSQVENALGPEPDWDRLRAEDPVAAHGLWIQRQEAKQALEDAKRQEAQERQVMLADQQRKMQAYLAAEKQKLDRAIPDLDAAALTAYGQSLGFTEQEIGSIADHRMIVVLDKARLYDDAVRRKDKIKPQRKGKKAAAPGAKDTMPSTKRKKADEAKRRLQESGRIEDAVALLMME